MKFFIGQVMPYITVTIFLLGLLWRAWRWTGALRIHNITLSPFARNWADTIGIILAQILFFWNPWKFDRPLWVGAWPMHVALAGVLGGHVLGIYFLGTQFIYIGLSVAASKQASVLLGQLIGVVFLVALLYLLYRRIAIEKVRAVSAPSDYLHLLLMLAIVVVGDLMRFLPSAELEYEEARHFLAGLFTFHPVPIPDNWYFIIHFLLVQILMIVFPFSKLVHPLGMLWERWIVNRPYQDTPLGLPGVRLTLSGPAGGSTGSKGV